MKATSSAALAKFVELDLKTTDALFSDNFFDLSAEGRKTVIIDKSRMSSPLSLEELRQQLTLRSLVDTY